MIHTVGPFELSGESWGDRVLTVKCSTWSDSKSYVVSERYLAELAALIAREMPEEMRKRKEKAQ